VTLDPEVTTALLCMVDAVRQMLSQIETAGEEGERDDSALIATLTRLQQAPAAPGEAPTEFAGPIASAMPVESVERVEAEEKKVSVSAPAPAKASSAVGLPRNIGEILMQQAGVTSTEILLAVKRQNEGDPRHLGEILVEHGATGPSDVVDALRVQQSSRPPTAASDSTIRVDVGLLDKVMNLVGSWCWRATRCCNSPTA